MALRESEVLIREKSAALRNPSLRHSGFSAPVLMPSLGSLYTTVLYTHLALRGRHT